MPSEWRELAVEDVAAVVGGGTPSTKRADYFDGDIPWLTPRISPGMAHATLDVENALSVMLDLYQAVRDYCRRTRFYSRQEHPWGTWPSLAIPWPLIRDSEV